MPSVDKFGSQGVSASANPRPSSSPRPRSRPERSIVDRAMGGIRSAGRQIRDDFRHATGQQRYTGSDLDNYNTRSQRSFEANEQFRNRNRNRGGGSSSQQTADQAPDMTDQYAENLRRYNEYMQSQQQPQQPRVTPDMRREALNIFESQQGAGQMPYYMAAARQGPNASPAFNYAAQNYATLGGAQRLAPRPMEMMSVAERQQINNMAQGMADQADYQQGMDMVMGGGGKGGPRTGPQLPPGMVGLPRTPDYGGRPQQPPSRFSPFINMLASRFGGMR
jgi:hypothetical protein